MSNQFYSICNISSTGFPHSVPDALLVSLQIHCFFIVHPWVYPQQNIYMNHTLVENNVDVKACIIFPSTTLLHIAISIDFEIIIIKKLFFFFPNQLLSSSPMFCQGCTTLSCHLQLLAGLSEHLLPDCPVCANSQSRWCSQNWDTHQILTGCEPASLELGKLYHALFPGFFFI